MRKVIYYMMVSLDGFIEGPNRELDWAIIDEELHQYINDQLDLKYGSRRVLTKWNICSIIIAVNSQ